MDITTEARTSGWYVIQQTGMQQWAEEHGTWKAHGVRLDLMHGNRRVAAATLMTLFEIGSVRSSVNHSVWCASRDSCADRPISRP